MSLVLLLDLDDTLLENNIEEFLPHYLGAFAKEVSPYVDPDRFVKALLKGTHEMVENRRPDRTLKETFEEVFFNSLDVAVDEFQGLADRFYKEVFPTLRILTRPIPQAVSLVEEAMGRNFRTAIATNPLFPLTAVLQRLLWANLPVEKYPFEVIASYETFHFTKPDPAYFIEVIGRMGWPSDATVMVGDDFQRDIIGSRKIGLPAFWINRLGHTLAEGNETPSASGTLGEVLPWLERTPEESLRPLFDSSYAMMAILRATPAIMDGLCRNLDDDAWKASPREGEWCATEIMCHLRDVDIEVNLARLRKVLKENNPFLTGEDTDPWANQRKYKLQDGRQALKEFIAARMETLHMLEVLKAEDWERPVRHAIFGPTKLIELINIIVGHDRLHVQQVYEVLGEKFRHTSLS